MNLKWLVNINTWASYLTIMENLQRQKNSWLSKVTELCFCYYVNVDSSSYLSIFNSNFSNLVKPILLYGCEVWAAESVDIIEKIHLRFCKYVLQVNKSTCSNMVYGELGVTPLVLHAKSRMIMFWARISNSSSTPKLSNILYQLIFNLYNRNIYKSPWLSTVKNTLEGCGFSGVWDNQLIPGSINSFKKKLQQRIKDQFFQHWTSEINLSRKCLNYRMFTTTLNLKTYLVSLSYRERGIMLSFAVETTTFQLNQVADKIYPATSEYVTCAHKILAMNFLTIFNCSHFEVIRKKLIKKRHRNSPSSVKFEILMNVTNKNQLFKLCKFIEKIIYFVK